MFRFRQSSNFLQNATLVLDKGQVLEGRCYLHHIIHMPINVVRAYKHLPGVTKSRLFTLDGKGIDGTDEQDSVQSWTRAERMSLESGIGRLVEWWAETENQAFFASATGADTVLWLDTDSGKRLGRCAHEARRTKRDLTELLG
jgi:hypothetical protein